MDWKGHSCGFTAVSTGYRTWTPSSPLLYAQMLQLQQIANAEQECGPWRLRIAGQGYAEDSTQQPSTRRQGYPKAAQHDYHSSIQLSCCLEGCNLACNQCTPVRGRSLSQSACSGWPIADSISLQHGTAWQLQLPVRQMPTKTTALNSN